MNDTPHQPEPLISVVICTYNRANFVGRAIDSVILQSSDGLPFELIVVDNNSNDATPSVVKQKIGTLTYARYIRDPAQGLSHARNKGLSEAKGVHIAFLDDDAIAEPGWLSAIAMAFATGGERVASVGGPINPIWEAPRPSWLSDSLLGYLSLTNYALPRGAQPSNFTPIGANVAYKRVVVLEMGGFPAELGRRGKLLISNEEVFVQNRLSAFGYTAYYEPAMAVRHLVPADHLTQRWFRKRAFWQGVSEAIESKKFGASKSVLLKTFLRKLGSFIRHPGYMWCMTGREQGPAGFVTSCAALRQLGFMAGILVETERLSADLKSRYQSDVTESFG
jgi:glucosyl-dolichyl phosphate glucuronosyltransferase